MAVPEGATKLGTVGIAYKGLYDELQTYKYANAVYYNGSTYIALIDNPAGFPSNDGVNWRYLAQGFLQQAISALTVIDESGILGTADAEVNAQEFLSKIAELEQGLENAKANKADILDSLEEVIANTEDGRIMGAKAGAELNSNLDGLITYKDIAFTGNSVAAKQYGVKTNISIAKSGYTAISVTLLQLTSPGDGLLYSVQMSSTTACMVTCFNHHGSDAYTMGGKLRVGYIKNS